MKSIPIIIIIIVALLLSACGPFHKDRVLNYETELLEVVQFVHTENKPTFKSDSDHPLGQKMKKLEIDQVYYNNQERSNSIFSGFNAETDSLVVFINRSRNLLEPEKRIIYDFADQPRNFGNDVIKGGAYEITQLSERWYFSTVGFD